MLNIKLLLGPLWTYSYFFAKFFSSQRSKQLHQQADLHEKKMSKLQLERVSTRRQICLSFHVLRCVGKHVRGGYFPFASLTGKIIGFQSHRDVAGFWGFFSGFRFHEVFSLQGCKSTNTSRTTGINGLIWLKLNYTVTFPSSFFKSSSNKPTWC